MSAFCSDAQQRTDDGGRDDGRVGQRVSLLQPVAVAPRPHSLRPRGVPCDDVGLEFLALLPLSRRVWEWAVGGGDRWREPGNHDLCLLLRRPSGHEHRAGAAGNFRGSLRVDSRPQFRAYSRRVSLLPEARTCRREHEFDADGRGVHQPGLPPRSPCAARKHWPDELQGGGVGQQSHSALPRCAGWGGTLSCCSRVDCRTGWIPHASR
jgi:hypothetical protein